MGLAVATLIAAIAFFVTSKLARREGKSSGIMQTVSKGLAVLVLVLAGAYFYGRFIG